VIRVAMQASIRKRMKQALRHAGSREVGGILMGQQLAVGHFAIVDFSLDDISGQDAHFVRDPENHRRALEHFFDQTGHDYQTFNYLGEWHSHPSFPARPSSIDIRSMQDLVEGERDRLCRTPDRKARLPRAAHCIGKLTQARTAERAR